MLQFPFLIGFKSKEKPKSVLQKSFDKGTAAKKDKGSTCKIAEIESEMARFFNGQVIENNEDPCKRQRDKAKLFFILQLAAMKYLAIPATESTQV